MLHTVKADERACAAEASLAVNSDTALFVLGCRQELRHDLIRGCRSINEEQVEMLDTLLDELVVLVLRLVETHDE